MSSSAALPFLFSLSLWQDLSLNPEFPIRVTAWPLSSSFYASIANLARWALQIQTRVSMLAQPAATQWAVFPALRLVCFQL